jgi:heparan-alpha-glucosaminide N-acetyltransferase
MSSELAPSPSMKDVTAVLSDSSPAAPPARVPPRRMGSIDAYRGLVMFLMMAEVLRFCAVAAALPAGSKAIWEFLCHHQSHVEWIGCVLHDMIQPSFSFLVGVALPFSVASRLARGQSKKLMTAHALWRSLLLVFLGVFLRSVGRDRTNFTFEDTLSQIGLGYTFLFLLAFRPTRDQWIAFVLIVVGYWGLFAAYPLPGSDFDYKAVGVQADWPYLVRPSPDAPSQGNIGSLGPEFDPLALKKNGFQAHWNKNSNPAWAFDTWLLNLFPRNQSFKYNGGGYATLSFIPTLATMILGLIAGGVLRREWSAGKKTFWFVAVGAVTLALGWGAGELGICPVVKRIWTPSWVLFSGGICFLFLAAFYAVIDGLGLGGWSFPLRVIGMNSIAAYVLSHLIDGFITDSFRTHLGKDFFTVLGQAYAPFLQGAAVLLVLWLILFWMYRRKLFLRI